MDAANSGAWNPDNTSALLHVAVQHLLTVESGLRYAISILQRAQLSAKPRDRDAGLAAALAHLIRLQIDCDVIRENVEIAELRTWLDEGLP